MKAKKSAFSVVALILTLVTCGIIAVVVFFLAEWSMIVDTFTGMDYEPTAEMQKIISSNQLTDDGMRILRASHPELQQASDFNNTCYSGSEKESSVLGCYTKKNIYVYDIKNQELEGIRETVLAHELMHAIWERTSLSERDKIQDDLSQIYTANMTELGDHMSLYSPDEYYDELHSIIGTQIPQSKMTADLREHYDKYFKNTDAIVEYFNAYDGKFKTLEQRAKELEPQISANRQKIDNLQTNYGTHYNQLSRDVQDFNYRAEAGKFPDNATFQAERSTLLSRQDDLDAEFDALDSLIKETNEMIAEYNSNVTKAGNLYESVDSRKNTMLTIGN